LPRLPNPRPPGKTPKGSSLRPHPFTALVKETEDALRDYLQRLAKRWGLDRGDAEACAQEAYLRLFQGNKDFDSLDHALNWLKKVGRHHLYDTWKEKKRQGFSLDGPPADDEERSAREPADQRAEARAQAEERERKKRELEQAVGQLAEEERELIRRKYIDGCTAEEIAAEQGTTRLAVQMRLQRIREKLRSLVKDSGPF
jgi:RNA polymerase sigma factor (sigma-70 family)